MRLFFIRVVHCNCTAPCIKSNHHHRVFMPSSCFRKGEIEIFILFLICSCIGFQKIGPAKFFFLDFFFFSSLINVLSLLFLYDVDCVLRFNMQTRIRIRRRKRKRKRNKENRERIGVEWKPQKLSCCHLMLWWSQWIAMRIATEQKTKICCRLMVDSVVVVCNNLRSFDKLWHSQSKQKQSILS